MKQINYMEILHIISEPGDGTRHNYACFKAGDDYCFMPIWNSFKYPQKISYWDIKDVKGVDEVVIKISKEYSCNIHTVMECIKTIQKIHKEIENGR